MNTCASSEALFTILLLGKAGVATNTGLIFANDTPGMAASSFLTCMCICIGWDGVYNHGRCAKDRPCVYYMG